MQNKLGILAKRVVVRPHVPWYYRLLIAATCISLLVALSWLMYNAGKKSVIPSKEIIFDAESYRSYDSSTCLQKEKRELCTQTAGLVRQLQINSTLHENLAEQVKTLGEENGQLKEELVFFQHLMSDNNSTNPGVSIHRFEVKQGENPGEYRYTLILVQGGQRPKGFKGNLKFLVTLRQNENKKTVPLTNRSATEFFAVNFKFYQRVEESFQVPADAIVESLQVQLFGKDKTKANLTQTVEPSS
ncbi:MAG: hypothetical protein NMNS01_08310 [Nitrosomonas sp.]|jgi:Family of unknown function (DUF6776)|nr:MAG: hypothetical protein NMNS01_08310 [Nitrosomonas sp.]